MVSGQGEGKTPEIGPTSATFLLCDHSHGIFLLYASVSPSVLVSLCNRWPLGISVSGIFKGLQRNRAEIGTPQRPALSCLQLLLQVPASDPPLPPNSVELWRQSWQKSRVQVLLHLALAVWPWADQFKLSIHFPSLQDGAVMLPHWFVLKVK